jgi:hypothetical protein
MTDELNAIIEKQDKVALDEYADARGIKLDRRKSFANMLTDFEEAMTAPDPSDEAELDALMEDPAPEAMASFINNTAPATGKLIKGDTEAHAAQDALVAAHTPAPDIDLSAQARDWAETFAVDIRRVEAFVAGPFLTVHIHTRHGDRRETVLLASTSKSDIKAAFDALTRIFVG